MTRDLARFFRGKVARDRRVLPLTFLAAHAYVDTLLLISSIYALLWKHHLESEFNTNFRQ